MKLLLIVLIVNCLTAALARLIWGGRLIYHEPPSSGNSEVYLIAGMLSQPENAFKYLSFNNQATMPLRYSVFGFNPKNSAKQLREIVGPYDTVVGISIGCKPILMSENNCRRRILINPMTHSIILTAKNQMLIEYLSPEAEVLTYLLGWISFIPFINTDTGDRYSLALLIDQLYWMYYGDPKPSATRNLEKVGIVISTEDEFLANDVMKDIYSRAVQIEIETMHGRTADPRVSNEYQKAIDTLF